MRITPGSIPEIGRLATATSALMSAAALALPVVPGASGFGMETRAAYGCGAAPEILRVTRLSDSGAGSLRAAVEAAGPRVIIFETSGTIRLASELKIMNPCVTIAGQSAPSPGILLRDYGIVIYTHDVLIQHLRIRPGWDPFVQNCNVGIYTWWTTTHDPDNIVLDHLSVSWSAGKNGFFWNSPGRVRMDITLWRSIFAEPLFRAYAHWNDDGDVDKCGSSAVAAAYGLGLSYHGNYSVLQSLFSQQSARNPGLGGTGASVYFANNVIHEWSEGASHVIYGYGGPSEDPPVAASLIGNHYRHSDRGGEELTSLVTLYGLEADYAQIHIADWIKDLAGARDRADDFVSWAINPAGGWLPGGFDLRVPSPPVTLPGYTPLPSSEVYETVLTHAGARAIDRDQEFVDTGILQDVRAYARVFVEAGDTARNVPESYPHGGFPNLAVINRPLTPPANPHSVQPSGYTALEEWLHGMARVVEGGGSSYTCPGGTWCGGAPVTGTPDQIVCGADLQQWQCTPSGWRALSRSCTCSTSRPAGPRVISVN